MKTHSPVLRDLFRRASFEDFQFSIKNNKISDFIYLDRLEIKIWTIKHLYRGKVPFVRTYTNIQCAGKLYVLYGLWSTYNVLNRVILSPVCASLFILLKRIKVPVPCKVFPSPKHFPPTTVPVHFFRNSKPKVRKKKNDFFEFYIMVKNWTTYIHSLSNNTPRRLILFANDVTRLLTLVVSAETK